MKGLSSNVHIKTFKYIKRTLNLIIKNNLENKNDPEIERSFKVIYIECKKYIKDTNPH